MPQVKLNGNERSVSFIIVVGYSRMRTKQEIETEFAERNQLDSFARFFLVGIGGAGMSALALILKERGLSVSGTDSTPSPATADLLSKGIDVHIGHTGSGISSDMALVLTDAIDLNTSPEVARARELGVPLFRRSQLLGWLLKGRKVIAVAGTHGKTTTTGLLSCGLIEAGLDPFVVAGAAIPQFDGPIVAGAGEYAVIEACEAYDSIRDYDPYIVVLTNLELDHVDFHGSFENLRASMVDFIARIADGGKLVYCLDDDGAREVADLCWVPKTGYTLEDWEGDLYLPGDHNRLNAAGALAAAALVADKDRARKGIQGFRGAERRLQLLRDGEITVIDDYAHTPAEVEASLSALKQRYIDRRLVVVYQPHLYSRTNGQFEAFAKALSMADQVVVTDIYPAREAPMAGVSSSRIAELTSKPTVYVPCRHLLPQAVARIARQGDVVCGMGAGNISEFAPFFIKELDRANRKQIKVAVVYGGESAEREVSLHSGRCVYDALISKGYDAKLVDVSEQLLSKGDLSLFIGPDRPDLAFLAIHGTGAEDGALQGLLTMLHIPFTGPGIQASSISINKALTKQILSQAGLRVPKGQLITSPGQKVEIKAPAIVKPNAQGSTVGLGYVEKDEDMAEAVRKAFQYDSAVLVEEWIQGIETSVPVMGDRALLPVEIAPATGRYDFASKYVPGATEEIIPARVSETILERLKETALIAHRALGCEGATRTDIFVCGDELIVLEVNTLPGMTKTSLLPNSAAAAGIPYEELVDWMAKDALKRYAEKT